MDDQATTQPTNSANQPAGPANMLPPPSGPPPNLLPSSPPADMNGQQTVPDSRALVEIPEEAGDNDLIEKEWVLKAKQIVEHTAEDPFTQQEELSKVRTDYLKKRYNRDLGTV